MVYGPSNHVMTKPQLSVTAPHLVDQTAEVSSILPALLFYGVMITWPHFTNISPPHIGGEVSAC